MIRKNSLSFKIITRVLAFTILLFVLILGLYYHYSRNTIRDAARENAILMAHRAVGNIEQILQPMEKIPELFASLMEIQPPHPDSLYAIVYSILEKNPEIYGTAIAFEPHYFPEKGLFYSPYAWRDGDQIQTMQLGADDYVYFYMDWYQIPKMIGVPYWTEPYYDEGGGNELMATYSVPFYTRKNGERHFAGIATVDVSLDWLTRIVSDIKIFESGYSFMISRNGVAITHPNAANIMNESIFSLAEELGSVELRNIGREMIHGISRFREHELLTEKGGKQWIYYTPLPSSQWSIGMVYPDDEMYASLRQITTILIILVIAGLILLSLITSQIVNRLAAPLAQFAQSAHQIAEGNFHVRLPRVSRAEEMQELHHAFSYMQKELDRYVADLKETTAIKEKIESELRIAREIQLSMIPHSFPPFPDLPQVDLYALLRSAKEVGGDLYDFFPVGNRFYFAIGDVSGKGVPASLFMAVTRTLLRSIADKEQSPDRIMNRLNKSLAQNNESNMFVTFFLGALNLSNGQLQYANAGHNPPVLLRGNGTLEAFPPAGAIPLGLFEDFSYPLNELSLEAGDRIFAYTDGVSEAENQQEELFGEETIPGLIAQYASASPRELIGYMEKAIESHVKDYPQSDDITMLCIAYNGNT